MISASLADAAPLQRRVVLDTNVVLDLLRFCDPRTAVLGRALRAGRVCAFTDSRCTAELERVLAYPKLSLDLAAQSRLMLEYRNTVSDAGSNEAADFAQLPLCDDPDDQKFLELAWRTNAALLTRDKALLCLRRRFAKLGGGRICTPEELIPHLLAELPITLQSDIGTTGSGA